MRRVILYILCACISFHGFSQASDALVERYRKMAVEYNHDINIVKRSVAYSVELEKSARADLKPKLAANGDFQYVGNPTQLSIDMPQATAPLQFSGKHINYGVGVSILQPIYTGGKILETIKLAELQQSYFKNNTEHLMSLVSMHTDIQYWSTVARAEMLSVTEEYRRSVASLAKIIKERVDAGLVEPQDLLMVEVKLNEADYNMLQAKNNFETGRMALNSIIGVDLSASTEVESQLPATVRAINPKAEVIQPSINMALDQIKIEEAKLRLNDAKYKPQIHIGINGTYSSPGYDFRTDLDPNYAVYAKISVPIFQWGKRKSEKRAAQENIGIAKEYLAKADDAVKLDIMTAEVNVCQALERVRLTQSSLAKANDNEKKAIERYDAGRASIVEVIDAQVYKQTAQLNYVEAKLSLQNSNAELIKSYNGYQ